MNPVFSTNAFWQAYLTLDPDGIPEADFAAQLDRLQQDFAVHAETLHLEYRGRQHTAIRRYVQFPFSCGERYSLLIEYEPDVNGCNTNLFLVDARSGTKEQMGWWDLAR